MSEQSSGRWITLKSGRRIFITPKGIGGLKPAQKITKPKKTSFKGWEDQGAGIWRGPGDLTAETTQPRKGHFVANLYDKGERVKGTTGKGNTQNDAIKASLARYKK